MNTPADAEKSPNWDDTLTPLLLDAMSKVYGYATYSDLCNDDDMPEVWSVADNIAKASEELQRRLQLIIDAARIDELEHVYCCDCEPVAQDGREINVCNDSHIDRIAQLSHPAPEHKSGKEGS